jgi:hypothetical protein
MSIPKWCVIVVAALAMGGNAFAKDSPKCDCRKFPWKPEECFDICIAKAFANTDTDTFKGMGFSKAIVDKFVAAKKAEGSGLQAVHSKEAYWSDWKERLSKDEQKEIRDKVKALPAGVAVSLAEGKSKNDSSQKE